MTAEAMPIGPTELAEKACCDHGRDPIVSSDMNMRKRRNGRN